MPVSLEDRYAILTPMKGYPKPAIYADNEQFFCKRTYAWTNKSKCAERAVEKGSLPCGQCALGALWLRQNKHMAQR